MRSWKEMQTQLKEQLNNMETIYNKEICLMPNDDIVIFKDHKAIMKISKKDYPNWRYYRQRVDYVVAPNLRKEYTDE